MWGRVVEFMLACWLAISPFLFGYPKDAHFFWMNDFTCSFLVACFSLASFYKPLRKMHLCNLGISFYLIALSYILQSSPMYEALQNYMVLGLLFLMIAIVPSDAEKSPLPWEEFYKRKHKS